MHLVYIFFFVQEEILESLKDALSVDSSSRYWVVLTRTCAMSHDLPDHHYMNANRTLIGTPYETTSL
jgi:hypothetical protein